MLDQPAAAAVNGLREGRHEGELAARDESYKMGYSLPLLSIHKHAESIEPVSSTERQETERGR